MCCINEPGKVKKIPVLAVLSRPVVYTNVTGSPWHAECVYHKLNCRVTQMLWIASYISGKSIRSPNGCWRF